MSLDSRPERVAPLRILHVSEVHWGGVVSLLQQFATEQLRAGHDVHLLAPVAMPTIPGVRHHDWRVDRRRPWSAATAMLDLRRVVRAVAPDVVHLHSFVAGFLGRVPASQLLVHMTTPVVYQPHAWSFDLFQQPRIGNLVRHWEVAAAPRTHVMVTNCTDEIDEGRGVGIDGAARAIGVAVDTARFHPVGAPAERSALRAELGITARHALLCVGRLARQKGQDLLVRAWERSRPPDTQLVLVGPGPVEELRASAPSQWGRSILAVGEHRDVRPWMWASDVLVLPSRYETVAIVVAEAMACGLPVAATAVNGARETILGGPLPAAGSVVSLGSMDELLAEAARRLTDSALWTAESCAGRQRAEVLFTPEEIGRRLESAYREAIDHHRGLVLA